MAKQVQSEIKKMLVRLNDPDGSFTDPTQDITISGKDIHEVESSLHVVMAIQGRCLIQLSELEEKAHYAAKEEEESTDFDKIAVEKEKKGKKA
jgi:hypothetical protein